MPRPGEPCSCYLVQTSDAAIVVDLGSGAFAQLELAIDYAAIDAVIISHVHADHFFDLVPFRYALKYGHLRHERPVALWLPPGGRRALESLRKAVSPDAPEHFFERVFHVREYDPRNTVSVKGVPIRFQRTRHYIDAFAMRIDLDGKSLTYSADTAPCDELVEFARGSSLFLCEAALGLRSESGERGHSSAREAGETAALAGVESLVLTHYPFGSAPDDLVNAAKGQYSGPIALAHNGLELRV